MSIVLLIVLVAVVFIIFWFSKVNKNLKGKASYSVKSVLKSLEFEDREHQYSYAKILNHKGINKDEMIVEGLLKSGSKIINKFQATVYFNKANKSDGSAPMVTDLMFQFNPHCINKQVTKSTYGYVIKNPYY